MAWIKLDDRMAEHPKLIAAGPLASYLHICAIQYANRNRTDGFIPARAIYTLIDLGGFGQVQGFSGKDQEPEYSAVYAHQLADALLSSGLWERVEGGYRVHDYLDYQSSAAEIDQYRAKDRARKQPLDRVDSAPTPNGFHAEPTWNPEPSSGNPLCKTETENKDRDEEEDTETDTESARAAPAAACVPDPVDWVWDYYRSEIQPDARVCPREKILARLKRFTPDELAVGIEHFAADRWWMEHNATRGAAWFFHSDSRSEQFLTMEPRTAPDDKAPRRLHG